jgi:SAM-dependent methyltransferase
MGAHMTSDERLISERFPRSSQYNPEWALTHVGSGSANALWLTEWLTSAMELRPGMRVLDLGCGPAMSSIFLHREFGVQVWATDLWHSASENLERIRDAGALDGVFPIHADARSLPFADCPIGSASFGWVAQRATCLRCPGASKAKCGATGAAPPCGTARRQSKESHAARPHAKRNGRKNCAS